MGRNSSSKVLFYKSSRYGRSCPFSITLPADTKKCERINAHADSRYRIDVANFLHTNEKKISQLIEIMGDNGIKWISDQVASGLVILDKVSREFTV